MRIICKRESVVEQKSRVALLPIGIEYFCACWDFPEALNDEACMGRGVPVEW